MASLDSDSIDSKDLLEAVARRSIRSYEIDRIQEHQSKQ
jgi:hypothetical protein